MFIKIIKEYYKSIVKFITNFRRCDNVHYVPVCTVLPASCHVRLQCARYILQYLQNRKRVTRKYICRSIKNELIVYIHSIIICHFFSMKNVFYKIFNFSFNNKNTNMFNTIIFFSFLSKILLKE